MLYIKRAFNILKWLFNNHFFACTWTICCLLDFGKNLYDHTSPSGYSILLYWIALSSWAPVWDHLNKPRIIPLHKDWRDFGKPKQIEEYYIEEEEEECEDEEEEIEDAQEEFNEQVSDRLDALSHLLYFDEAHAIDMIEEDNFDGTTTFTIKYKKL